MYEYLEFFAGRCSAANPQMPQMFGYQKSIPMQSGAEAVETALKIARRYGYVKKGIPEDKALIISVTGCYHGRTLATTSLNNSSENRSRMLLQLWY